jgi:hypothetical protein
MSRIITTTVGKDTLDESQMVYKPIELITEAISETVSIIDRIKPIYNFKAGGD